MFDYLRMPYKDSDHTIVTAVMHPHKCTILGWNSSWWWSYECPASTFIGSTALRKGPWRFWLHCHDCHCAL